MSMVSKNFGLFPNKYFGEDDQCADKGCTRILTQGDDCFIDTIRDGKMLCDLCGKCLRYSRKKAAERGEPIEDVEQDF